MKLQCGQPMVAHAAPHVGIVDRGPKVIYAVWTEQKALKHTNTCVGYITAEACVMVRQRHTNRGGSQTEVRKVCVCVVVDELDYMQCQYKSEGIYMSNACKKNKSFCGQWSRGTHKVWWIEKTTMC